AARAVATERAGTNLRNPLSTPQSSANKQPCQASALPGGRILEPPPKARGNGARLCAEHQPQRHGEATRFGIIRRLWASALAAAGPSDTAAVRWCCQDAPRPYSCGRHQSTSTPTQRSPAVYLLSASVVLVWQTAAYKYRPE